MTVRRVPILPTLLVLAAVVVMIALGFWQLDRKAEKEALLDRYTRAVGMSAEVPWPRTAIEYPAAFYRHSRVDCVRVEAVEAVAGRSITDEAGWAQIARCRLADGGMAAIALGWSSQPVTPDWAGGVVSGFVGPAGKSGVRLIAAPAQAGLEQLAAPDPANLPNNHLSYAVQWFAFAATALVIYALALRGRWRER